MNELVTGADIVIFGIGLISGLGLSWGMKK